MYTAFPCSDYYGSSAPSHRQQPTTHCPTRRPGWTEGRDQRDGSHVHSRTVRRGRCPTMPLQLRHTYAAGIRCGLPTGDINQSKSSPPNTGARRDPAQIRQVRAGGALLRGVHTLVHRRYTFPSHSPDPHHLTVLARPGFVRAASTLPGVSRIRLPSASTGPLRRADGGVLSSPHGPRAPRGARCPNSTPGWARSR
jgi:hypothetical protein